jgi:hypothetical protein
MPASRARISEWIKLASAGRVVRRATMTAVIVGAFLIGINHGDAIIRHDVTPPRLLRMILTFLVPYLVSTA